MIHFFKIFTFILLVLLCNSFRTTMRLHSSMVKNKESRLHMGVFVSSQAVEGIFDKHGVERSKELNVLFEELLILNNATAAAGKVSTRSMVGTDVPERTSEMVKREIQQVTAKWKRHDDDVGSSEYQIAMLSVKIKHLTVHFLKNIHDFHSKRGMHAMVNTRRKLMNYLYKKDRDKALQLAEELDFRFRPNDRQWDTQAYYLQFMQSKSVKVNENGKLVRKKYKPRLLI